jgi:homoserine acetyltransferase
MRGNPAARKARWDPSERLPLPHQESERASRLGLEHVGAFTGNPMDGMHTFLWGGRCPDDRDALGPVASQPDAAPQMIGRT